MTCIEYEIGKPVTTSNKELFTGAGTNGGATPAGGGMNGGATPGGDATGTGSAA